jgi:hypothetical protein
LWRMVVGSSVCMLTKEAHSLFSPLAFDSVNRKWAQGNKISSSGASNMKSQKRHPRCVASEYKSHA